MTDALRVVLDTKWFRVAAKDQTPGDPYYLLQLPDYVSVVALTPARELVLVRQFRPVVERQTLELPSGHVDAGETAEDAARRELFEETGFVAPRLELLGTLVPDVGRLANRMWCYFAADVRPTDAPHEPEPGVAVVVLPEQEALRCAADGTIDHALNLAPLFLALAGGQLSLTARGHV
ncbi:MAG: NUDIX hydrolase [Acidobacteria bacterium]|nr:MAG: NUDIX hydrolase [Acidobacteriota bacterium]